MLLNIFVKYLSFSHLFVFTIAYFFLDDIKNKKRVNYLLMPLILLFGMFVGYFFTFIDIVVLYIFFLILSVKNSEERNIISSLLTVSSACFVEMLVGFTMKPLLYFALEKQSAILFLIILLLNYGLLILCITGYKKWLLPMIRKKKIVNLVAYLLTLSLFIYFFYSTISIYASTFYLKILVGIFYFVLLAFGGVIIQSVSNNHDLKIEAEKKRLEYDIHQHYIEKEEFEELKDFFHSSVNKTKTFFGKDILHADELNKLDSLDVKSILTMKLIAAQEKEIDVQIESDDGIKLNQKVDSVLLIRILGILLDNAIEELENIADGKLSVGIFSVKGDTIFVIENTTRERIEPLQVLKQKGYSTKGEGRGLGLSNIDELTAMEPNILLETIISDQRFIQKVVVMGEEA